MKSAVVLLLLVVGCGGEEFAAGAQTTEDSDSGAGGLDSGSGGDGAGGSGAGADIGERCSPSVVCLPTLVCLAGVDLCVEKSVVGGSCARDEECETGRCRDGTCVAPPPPYDGPAYVEMSDEPGVVSIRGLDGPPSQYVVWARAPWHGEEAAFVVSGSDPFVFNTDYEPTREESDEIVESNGRAEAGLELERGEIITVTFARKIAGELNNQPATDVESVWIEGPTGRIAAWP